MGYRVPTNVLNLRYEDFPGLQVQASSLPLGTFLKLARLADKLQRVDASTLSEDEALTYLAEIESLLGGFAKALKEWNLTDDDDKPIPGTYEGLLSLDAKFALSVVMGWINAIGGLHAPLSNGSSGGGTSPEASLPMEPSSSNPPS